MAKAEKRKNKTPANCTRSLIAALKNHWQSEKKIKKKYNKNRTFMHTLLSLEKRIRNRNYYDY